NSGGGAGGSIHLSARTISGTGTISANGARGNNLGGGGAGGAIAFSSDTNSFTGAITATGGGGANYGGTGIIVLSRVTLTQPNTPSLILDNGGNRGAKTPLISAGSVFDVTITGGAVASNTLPIYGQWRNLLIGSNSVFQ